MVLQHQTQSSIDNQSFTDDSNLSETNEMYHFKNHLYSKQNELEPDPSKENTTSTSNLKRKPKQNQQSSLSIHFHKRSIGLGSKRSRV